METVHVAGVPEHFNYAWHVAMERGLFHAHDVHVVWQDVGAGTGAMIALAQRREVDIIVALTEGLVAAILGGAELALLGTYVQSPLRWGVLTGAQSHVADLDDALHGTIAISRKGSGSHLMACVLALERGANPHTLSLSETGAFADLRRKVNEDPTACFLWEHFTSKPFVDSGELREVGDITTPWACFLMAAPRPVTSERTAAFARLLVALREACSLIRAEPDTPAVLAERYGLQPDDAAEWWGEATITASAEIASETLERAAEVLYQARVTTVATPFLFLSGSFVQERSAQRALDAVLAPVAHVTHGLAHMKLYAKPELVRFVRNELHARGLHKGSLQYTNLLAFDQHHYGGTKALDEAAQRTTVTAEARLLLVGSGLGGPARYYAGRYHAHVTAIEVQEPLHRTAAELTRRCGLGALVQHLCGDAVAILPLPEHTHALAWLTLLHVPDKARLLTRMAASLSHNGVLHVEELCALAPLTSEEERVLREEVCASLPSAGEYSKLVVDAGFTVRRVDDLTAQWAAYTAERVRHWETHRAALVSVHREHTYGRLLSFYTTVRDLFRGGRVGGLRIVAERA